MPSLWRSTRLSDHAALPFSLDMPSLWLEAMTAREGLPPCIVRAAVFDGRQATWHDGVKCKSPDHDPAQAVLAGMVNKKIAECTSLLRRVAFRGLAVRIRTDDPAAAEAAYERAEVYVRVGELP